jgi:sensor histidine kinase YesM
MRLFFGVSLVITIMIFAMIIISFASRMSRDYVRMQVKDLQIKKEENYLFLLKKQINAHFTVNTLSAVRTLIKKGELEEAGEISDGLSFLLRYANAGEENIDLMEELFTLDRYAGIMKIRYPGKFKLLIEPDEECENVCIPRMLLQPILENAIVHGLASNSGTIRILASAGEDTVIKIMDTGCGIEKEALKELNLKLDSAASDDEIDDGIEEHGKALINIQKRIYMLFGEGYGVTVESVVDEWTTVTVTLPSIPNE